MDHDTPADVFDLIKATARPATAAPIPLAPSAIADTSRYEAIRTEDGSLALLDKVAGKFVLVQGPAAGSTPAGDQHQGLGRTEKRLMVWTGCGVTLMLGAGGMVTLVGHGLAEAAPGLHSLAGVLEWGFACLAVLAFIIAAFIGRRAMQGPAGPKKVVYHNESHGFMSRATMKSPGKG